MKLVSGAMTRGAIWSSVRVPVASHHAEPSKSSSNTRRGRPSISSRPAGKAAGKPASDRQLSSTAAAAGAAALDASVVAPSAEAGFEPQRLVSAALTKYRALVLDSSYRPVDVVNWQRAICMDLLSKADALEYYDVLIHSVSDAFYLPAVLRTRWYHKQAQKMGRISLSRQNLLLRDNFECQYCGSTKNLTLDHVHPISKGGCNSWENLVTCCSNCNSKKGDKTLKQLRWKLRHEPREPSAHELEFLLSSVLRGAPTANLPEEWRQYLPTVDDSSFCSSSEDDLADEFMA